MADFIDMVKFLATTSDDTIFTTGAAVAGYQGAGNLTDGIEYYFNISQGVEWEIVRASRQDAAGTITILDVLSSSVADQLIVFGAGDKTVMCVAPAAFYNTTQAAINAGASVCKKMDVSAASVTLTTAVHTKLTLSDGGGASVGGGRVDVTYDTGNIVVPTDFDAHTYANRWLVVADFVLSGVAADGMFELDIQDVTYTPLGKQQIYVKAGTTRISFSLFMCSAYAPYNIAMYLTQNTGGSVDVSAGNQHILISKI